jgi:virginiamycin A acetyltransferase
LGKVIIKLATKEELLEKGLWVNDINNLTENCRLVIEPPVRILDTTVRNARIGAYTFLRGGYVQNVKSIGRFCSIAKGFVIGLGEHPLSYLSTHPFQYEKVFPFWEEAKNFTSTVEPEQMKSNPVIGNDVWIGANVTVLRGVSIGDGAVIAAGAVVHRNVEPYEVVGGVPAKHIKYRFDEDVRKKLLELKWWNYTLESLDGIQFNDIQMAIQQLEERKEKGLLKKRKREFFEVIKREIGEKEVEKEVKKEVEKEPQSK